jgi:hypothetical protein
MLRVLLMSALLAAACGPAIPEHNGYKGNNVKPWRNAKVLELDEVFEAEVDESVDYRKRKRAKWYAIDTPEYGELQVKLTASTLALGEVRNFDLAFEVLDSNFNMLTRADAEEDDAGEEKKERTLYELSGGRYFVHIYAQQRVDAADFTLRVLFKAEKKAYESNFPAKVAYVSALAAVPPVDDSPLPEPPKRCRGKNCKKRTPKVNDKPSTSVQARISGITASGGGTRIKINKGSSAGVQKGWKGSVITKGGSSIAGGGFTVSSVSSNESYATVSATPDAVTSAKYVRLRPP